MCILNVALRKSDANRILEKLVKCFNPQRLLQILFNYYSATVWEVHQCRSPGVLIQKWVRGNNHRYKESSSREIYVYIHHHSKIWLISRQQCYRNTCQFVKLYNCLNNLVVSIKPGARFYQHGLSLILIYINNQTPNTVWGEITYLFPKDGSV